MADGLEAELEQEKAQLRGVTAELRAEPVGLALVKDGNTLETLLLLPAQAEHRSFIISTWVKSGEALARKHGISKDIYSKHEPAIAESRWTDCHVVTDADGYTVHAYACGSDGNLWQVYVVPELRRLRVATRLVEYVTGGLKFYSRPWPYAAHARTNPYLHHPKGNQ